jgi:hypothetical protein
MGGKREPEGKDPTNPWVDGGPAKFCCVLQTICRAWLVPIPTNPLFCGVLLCLAEHIARIKLGLAGHPRVHGLVELCCFWVTCTFCYDCHFVRLHVLQRKCLVTIRPESYTVCTLMCSGWAQLRYLAALSQCIL